jgi:hypothetical protein
LFARGGYFSGTLEATTIKTANIIGDGTEVALLVKATANR